MRSMIDTCAYQCPRPSLRLAPPIASHNYIKLMTSLKGLGSPATTGIVSLSLTPSSLFIVRKAHELGARLHAGAKLAGETTPGNPFCLLGAEVT